MTNKWLAISVMGGLLIGVIFAAAFFHHAATIYSLTPSDPQKAVGYVFIALYSAFVGATSFSSAFFGLLIMPFRHHRTKMLEMSILSFLFALATVALIIFSPG